MKLERTPLKGTLFMKGEKNREAKADFPMGHVLRYRTAQNLCSASCPIQHIDIPGNTIKEPTGSWPEIRGLQSLNYSRDKWLNGHAIEVSTKAYCWGLPKSLQDKIGLTEPGVNPNIWLSGKPGRDALHMAIKTPARRALALIKKTEWSFLPVCSGGNHWVTVVLHKQKRLTDEKKDEWSHVAQMAILDPFREASRMRTIGDRMREWLEKAGAFTFGKDPVKVMWQPLQKDATSCGPRAYWNTKQLMDRLLEMHEAGVSYSNNFWRDLSGWFNEDFVRGEMIGRCAWDGVRQMDWNARVSIEKRTVDLHRPDSAAATAAEVIAATGGTGATAAAVAAIAAIAAVAATTAGVAATTAGVAAAAAAGAAA
ncbi:hypothetical protein GQX73_g6542 [Xylaria multiplex]|uniref:Ubiquitin-like protease family profile domain-containing protein n=1 Tax=Xylaria multiplex TaxID=323545 RepID=A0A7C8MP45_9PEZI|nr:hypothetical protein GQX73_g6542 [Xylaria multiplex]